MKFGVCGDVKMAALAARDGYDYMEWSVAELLRPRESEEAFKAAFGAQKAATPPYQAANGFVPGDLKITGPNVDASGLEAFVRTTMERAGMFGLDIIVFGSGGARQIPDGFDRQRAHDQLVAFCRMVGPIAQRHGITVAIEPLNKAECNVLNTVAECAALVNEVAHPAIRLLADAYHMMRDGDPVESILEHGHLLVHTHIATVPSRYAPAAEPCDFAPFFAALKKVQYRGRVSIEGKIPHPETELAAAITLMRPLA